MIRIARPLAFARRHAVLFVLFALFAARLAAAPMAAGTAAGTASGKATVDGKPLVVTNAYLFHAPDNWTEGQTNAVVLLSPTPLDPQALAAAKTLKDLRASLGQHVIVEIRPDRKVDLSICHDAFGKGMCYSTTVQPSEWKPGVLEPKRASGEHVTTFTGEAEKVFEKYELFYDLSFDAAWVKDFTARR